MTATYSPQALESFLYKGKKESGDRGHKCRVNGYVNFKLPRKENKKRRREGSEFSERILLI